MVKLRWKENSPPQMPGPAFALLALTLLLAARFLPVELLAPACQFKSLSGLPCVGCGSTRAFVRFVHGDFIAALQLNPLGTLLAVSSVLLVLYTALRFTVLRRRPVFIASPGLRTLLRRSAMAFLAINWIYLLVVGR